MGRLKQMLPVGGVPMVRRVVDAACSANAETVIVVTGANAAQVTGTLAGTCAQPVYNASYESGTFSSLRAGLAELHTPVVVLVADQPNVTSEAIEAVGAELGRGAWGVMTEYLDGAGHPWGLSSELISDLPQEAPDRFVFGLLSEDPRLARVQAAGPRPLDVNTVDEYRSLAEGDHPVR